MPAEIFIRPATAADIPVLIHHRRMMWWDMGRQNTAALDQMEVAAQTYFASAIPNGSYRGFLAVTDGDTIAGGAGIVVSPWPGSFDQELPRRAMILNMYVEKAYRRRGIARTLMEEMIAWCRSEHFAYVGLHASDEGRLLYEKLGFRATNEMRLELK
ncbi:MAG TPA: GNAT family N-acetyltransferase [Gemmatimonadaceae bacterium]